ncbi:MULTISPECIES: CTP synthase [unclassified Mycoplasma]|uniref:CTP synthase n=1 Tax=unclassified Mycoplasma TaxID=2683645 RepID=UPI00211CE568|nr:MULTISPECIES: CTP synthase [unclassified Mycoplasma]UUM19993.1 CTP synthase [Mycoplasma sp. 1578d]UUM24974.1 CTP synthase [Mycoplasma sp. 3686d]
MSKTKIIALTGGVFSSLGKGLVLASIGRILHTQKFKVATLKLDPYLNIDPGTMSPVQHGEIFVTHDGMEADLDLGHYERFLDYPISKTSSLSAGQIYQQVLTKERAGDYLGKTIQIVPHLTNEIHERINQIIDSDPDLDFLLIELGGTVGDIESLPFIEALRSYKFHDSTRQICFIHVSPLIRLNIGNEIKTKPTQHSVMKLREHGIIPNVLILRTSYPFDQQLHEKIALYCNIDNDKIFYSQDVDNIYLLPQLLYEQKIHTKIFEFFKLDDPRTKNDLSSWLTFTDSIVKLKKSTYNVALVGKYVQLADSYLSIIESFNLASYHLGIDLKLTLIDATKIKSYKQAQEMLGSYDGICVPYGFGSRGIEGKMFAIQYAREHQVPFLGICLGMQLAVIEYARNVLKLTKANSMEFDVQTPDPLFTIQPTFHNTNRLGGTLSLGSSQVAIKPNTLAYEVYQSLNIVERYRHRYDFNPQYLDKFNDGNFVFSGVNSAGAESLIELKNHPFFIACQFHPEFLSKPLKPHPLFVGLLSALMKKNQ